VVALRARPLGLGGLHELDDLIARSRALRRAHALRVRLARMLRRRRAATTRRPVEFTPRLVPVAGGTLEVWEAGAGGIPCVYFHPYLLGGPPAPGGTLADTLAGAGRTIVVAPRGLGGSSAPASPARLRLSQIVDDMESVRTALGIDEWVPVGWSLGGAAALEYTLSHPAATARLVLVCSPSSWRFYEDPASIYNPLHPDSWREEEARRALDGTERTSRAWLELTLGDAMRNEAAVDEFLEGAQLSPPALHALRDDLLADPPWDAEDRLGEITCPVLVVAGRHDTQVPPAAAETLAALLPRAELALFDASGHHPAEEEPARFREVVTDFLSRAGTPAADPQASGV
jgi:proline iminopeptidase